MDPTTTWALIRGMVESWYTGNGSLRDFDRLAELVTGLDEGLTRGDHLPSQWTAPGFDFPEPHWEEWLMVPVTDPDRTLTVIREHVRHGQPQETGRVLALLAGLDYWINCQCNHLPRDWTTE